MLTCFVFVKDFKKWIENPASKALKNEYTYVR